MHRSAGVKDPEFDKALESKVVKMSSAWGNRDVDCAASRAVVEHLCTHPVFTHALDENVKWLDNALRGIMSPDDPGRPDVGCGSACVSAFLEGLFRDLERKRARALPAKPAEEEFQALVFAYRKAAVRASLRAGWVPCHVVWRHCGCACNARWPYPAFEPSVA